MAHDRTTELPTVDVSAANTAVRLRNGMRMPAIGYGTFRLAGGGQARAGVAAALSAGYRHIDTATLYGNESDVGAAVQESGLDRDDVWITTKLWNGHHGGDVPLRALEVSLARLGVDAVDLWLMHWPVDQRLDSWKTMERAHRAGLARSIGVSNFLRPHLAELLDVCDVVPVVDQIELSPFLLGTRRDTVDFAQEHGITVQSYSPLTQGARLYDGTVSRIAAECGVTTAQVMLRWAVQHGFVPLPRSSNVDRMRQNLDVFSFELSAAQMAELDDLDEGLVTVWDPADTL
jgi:diketogulonate reductase-like aldo/keto reductase